MRDLERGWDLESATALAGVGPGQASPEGGNGGAIWWGPTSDALNIDDTRIFLHCFVH